MEEYEEFKIKKNEAKVYEQLVRLGKIGSGDLSRESGVPYGKIYNILDSLINKGLAEVIPEKTKKFVPTSPKHLIEFIEEKQKKLEKAKEKAKKMKQFYDVKEKNPIVMEIGRKGFYKIVKELKHAEDYNYTIKWTSEYRPDWAENLRKNLKKGRDIKTLTRYDKETEKDEKEYLKINKNIRKFSNEGVAMSIIDNEQVMIALIKSNVTLMVRDKPLAKIMKQMFLDSYKDAEIIK